MDVFDFRERGMVTVDEEVEDLARRVPGAAIEVRRAPGPGLPEAVCQTALSHELKLRRVPHECEVPMSVVYKGVAVGEGFVDILAGGKLVVELKSVEALADVRRPRVVAYLKVLDLPLGLLMNFNAGVLKNGIKRVINTQTSAS